MAAFKEEVITKMISVLVSLSESVEKEISELQSYIGTPEQPETPAPNQSAFMYVEQIRSEINSRIREMKPNASLNSRDEAPVIHAVIDSFVAHLFNHRAELVRRIDAMAQTITRLKDQAETRIDAMTQSLLDLNDRADDADRRLDLLSERLSISTKDFRETIAGISCRVEKIAGISCRVEKLETDSRLDALSKVIVELTNRIHKVEIAANEITDLTEITKHLTAANVKTDNRVDTLTKTGLDILAAKYGGR
jgi:hypothetical protein